MKNTREEDNLTQEQLKSLFKYDPDTGVFTNKYTRNSRAIKGASAGHLSTDNGYVRVTIARKKYPAHRLVFMYMGEKVPNMCDHVNGIRDDNRWSNLRACSPYENGYNVKLLSSNSSGYKGVWWAKYAKKWRAQIIHKSKRIHLGYFDDPVEAHQAYCKKSKELHGEFSNTGC